MTEEQLNANFIKYISRLKKYNCYSQEMIDEIGDALKRAPYCLTEEGGGAYEGGMIDIVLNRLCRLAYDLNTNGFGLTDKNDNIEHPKLMVNTEMLMRVLLLQHIGKSEMFIPQPEEWKRKKGWIYEFNDAFKSNLRLGERSLYLCQKYGIVLNDEEYEAIRIIDREWDEKHLIMSSPICAFVRICNLLTTIELKQ